MNYRRAALLGLNSPLSAVMMAVLGIWPGDDEDEPIPVYVTDVYGGGRRKIQFSDLDLDEPQDADAEHRRRTMMILAAIAAEEMCE